MENEDLLPEAEDEALIDAPIEDETQQDDAPPTLEDIASEMGWSPKESWRGDPDKWKPAHEYVKATAEINSKLSSKVSNVEKQLQTLARTSAQITEQALAKQRDELLAARNEAIEMGDREGVDRADEQLRSLRSAAPAYVPPTVQEWQERNPWFEKDQTAKAWAVNRAGELARNGLDENAQLGIVEREAKQLFPELFQVEEKPKPKAADLSAPGRRASPRKAKTFHDLPADARAAADEFVKSGRCTREQFVKIYFEENEV